MTPDTKRFCRTQYGYVLKRLCKKFGAIEIAKLVPGNDEVTHKRIKKIRKLLNQERKNKNSKDDGDDNDDDEDDGFEDDDNLEKKSYSIDDILADSDSEIDDEEDAKHGRRNSQQPATKKRKKDQTYIQESPEAIVDLADLNSIGKITSKLLHFI